VFREAYRRYREALVLVTGVALAGCGAGGSGDDTNPDDPHNPGQVTQPASARSRVKRKSPALLAGDLGQALDLPRAALCRELAGKAADSGHDCFEAHDILLGGVEPYELRIDEPLLTPTVAAPMAVDRIVLSACGERVARDFATPDQAVVFTEVASQTGQAGQDGFDDDARAAVAARLYERLLARPARADEIDALVGFDAELGANPRPRDWAQLTCYAVATTTEFLFY
jgi:hypothetical protein